MAPQCMQLCPAPPATETARPRTFRRTRRARSEFVLKASHGDVLVAKVTQNGISSPVSDKSTIQPSPFLLSRTGKPKLRAG